MSLEGIYFQPTMSSSPHSLQTLLKAFIVLEATRFKRETKSRLPRWTERLIAYEQQNRVDGNLFVHFSRFPKMGLYLKNSYNTPIGFYAYPLIDESISSFAVERPFMIIVKPKPEARLLDLSRHTEEQLKQDGEKLKTAGFDPNVVDEATEKTKNFWDLSGESSGFPGKKIWDLTRILSGTKVGEDEDGNDVTNPLSPGKEGGGPTARWSYIFWKVLGYDGVVDNNNIGIIHPNEPNQAVFFNTTKLEIVDVIEKEGKEEGSYYPARKLFSKPQQAISGDDYSNQEIDDLQLTNAMVLGTDFTNSTIKNSKMIFSRLGGSKFINAKLNNVVFTNSNLAKVKLVGASCYECFFDSSQFFQTKARGARFTHCNFTRATNSESDFSNTEIRQCSFLEANCSYTSFENAKFIGTKISGGAFRNCNFTNADMRGINTNGGVGFVNSRFAGADLRGVDMSGWILYGSSLANLPNRFAKAIYNSSTKFPPNFDPAEEGMRLVDD